MENTKAEEKIIEAVLAVPLEKWSDDFKTTLNGVDVSMGLTELCRYPYVNVSGIYVISNKLESLHAKIYERRDIERDRKLKQVAGVITGEAIKNIRIGMSVTLDGVPGEIEELKGWRSNNHKNPEDYMIIKKRYQNGFSCSEVLKSEIGKSVIIIDPDNTETPPPVKKGFTWEESFGTEGYYIGAYSCVEKYTSNSPSAQQRNQCIFKTKEQAESSLAFAQLTHIVAKYNEGKESKSEAYAIQCRNGREGFLCVEKVTFGSQLPHMVFLTEEDANLSLIINKDLWHKYWMISPAG